MRLIDADALTQNKPEEYIDGTRVYFQYEIDNAPTVENLYTPRQMQDAYLKGKRNRPQGEWIIEHLPKNIKFPDDCYTCVSCSECGFHYDYMFHQCNFCPNCGAEMKGGKE